MTDSNKARSSGGGFGSRIPKISFGFRKQTKNVATAATTNGGSDNGSCSERSTPEGCEGTPPPSRTAGTKKQAPGSNNSSPTVGRSKSLRLPRSTNLKYTARSNMGSVRDREEAEDYYPDDLVDSGSSGDGSASEQQTRIKGGKTGQTSLAKSGRPRSSTMSSASSRSRSISPGGLMMTAVGANGGLETSRFGFYGGSLSQSESNEGFEEPADVPSSFSRRSQSFSAKHHTRIRAGSAGPQNRLQPPQAGTVSHQPFRRSKTPTALSQRTAQTGQTSLKNGNSKLGLNRTSSLGKVKQQSTGLASVQTRHSEQQRARKSSADTRGKRPSSEVILESATADLNAIAQELSQGDADQPEVKTVSGRIRPSSAKNLFSGKRSNSAIGFNKTFNPRCDTPEQQAPPTSVATPPSAAGKTKLLSAGGRQGSIDKANRPFSAREQYQHRRNESIGSVGSLEPPIMETRLERSHSAANFEAQGGTRTHSIVQRKASGGSGGGGRSSAPSSGRSTPVQRSVSGSKIGKDVTDGGVVSTGVGKAGAGLPPRTPYKVARTKATPTSGPTGINELEGSVLLEADDYRRISNEVKSMKTALLKLKREIQADFEGKTPSSQPNQTPRTAAVTPVRVGRSVTSPASTPGPAHSDLRKKLKTVTTERDKALDEVGSCKKELKTKTGRIESLMDELEAERLKNKELASELEQVESQRNRLLDKVERLHADKHNLEARLNTLERASIYEQTFSESWLDEGGYDDDDLDIMDPALGADGGVVKGMSAAERKEMTESEIGDLIQSDGGEGESSEPESSAVCSLPVS